MNDGDSVCFRLAIEDKTEEIYFLERGVGQKTILKSTSRKISAVSINAPFDDMTWSCPT